MSLPSRPGRGHRGLAVLPRRGRLLAVDPGRVRVGLAVTDADQRVASPLDTVPAGHDHEQTADAVATIVAEHDVAGVVVGWPRALDGTDGPAAQDAARLAKVLLASLELPVLLWDERFTTVEAERVMIAADTRRERRRQDIDRVAATLLLQTVLDARSTTSVRPPDPQAP